MELTVFLKKFPHVATYDIADHELVSQYKWYAWKHRTTIYAVASIRDANGKQTQIKMHRLIMGVTDPKILIDHKNGNGLCNTRENLRICTNQQNLMNRGAQKNSTSGLKGVFWSKQQNMWFGKITISGKQRHLGFFACKDRAALAYNEASKRLCGNFAWINPVKEGVEPIGRRLRKTNKSGYIGVCFHKRSGKYYAATRQRHIGSFDTAIEAAYAYDKRVIELFGEEAILNFKTH
jgi:hypothetical protein